MDSDHRPVMLTRHTASARSGAWVDSEQVSAMAATEGDPPWTRLRGLPIGAIRGALSGPPSETRLDRLLFKTDHLPLGPQGVPNAADPVIFRHGHPTMGPHLGRMIRQLRAERGLSQSKLAEAADVDTSYVSKLEGGQIHRPSGEVIERLASRLAIDPEVLYSYAGAISPRVIRQLTKSPLALRFTQEAVSSRLSAAGWGSLLASLEEVKRRQPAGQTPTHLDARAIEEKQR